ncbi:MAG TPA: hypothetical protein VK324_16370 [Tepidisphaeraceae bacterium]|nr:hypothetical protein [Tepidisphaeraceae bacterium]
MFTLHGYATWEPDHPMGYVRRGEGVLPPDPVMAANYAGNASFDAFRFDRSSQQVVVDAVREACSTIGVRLHYVVCVSTHAHAVVSWRGGFTWDEVYDRIKSICGMRLAKHCGTAGTGRPYFSEGRDSSRVRDRGHFLHLMRKYLPGHHGVMWRDRDYRSSRGAGPSGG